MGNPALVQGAGPPLASQTYDLKDKAMHIKLQLR